MSLITLVIILVVIGVGLYLINQIEMDEKIKKIINVVVILVVVLWILKALLGGSIPDIRLGQVDSNHPEPQFEPKVFKGASN